MTIAKYRDPNHPDRWYLTDFTMSQVEGRISDLEKMLSEKKKQLDLANLEITRLKSELIG